MDRIGLQRPARYNEHSLIEGYCLNLRQYSRSAPKDQSFWPQKHKEEYKRRRSGSGRLIRQSETSRLRDGEKEDFIGVRGNRTRMTRIERIDADLFWLYQQ